MNALASVRSVWLQFKRGSAGRGALSTVNPTLGRMGLALATPGSLHSVDRCPFTRGTAQKRWSFKARCAAPCPGNPVRAAIASVTADMCLMRSVA